jgi:hypothetical protein
LATKEDSYHIHKILGMICFVNFIYQFYHAFFYGHINSHSSLFFIHGLLPISSIVFHIPAIRNPKAPMIYPEFRLHSIAFGLRSVVCAYLSYYQMNMSYKIFACYLTMIFADIASYMTKQDNDKTLIRNMPFDENVSELDKKKVAKFHSSMQIGATLYMLGNIDSAFFTLYGIQLPAFLMTLVRKNIIKPNMWHNLYTILLISNIFAYYSLPLSFIFTQIPCYFLFRYMRFNNKMNKYLAWSITFNSFFILYFIFREFCPIDFFIGYRELYIKRAIIAYYIINSLKNII